MQHAALGPDGQYHTRLLAPNDLRALQTLFERAADYFAIATGAPPAPDEAPRAFVAGPPTKDVSAKRVVGVFAASETLVGVLDALTDWPEDGTWSIGMLLLDPAYRGRGLGGHVLDAFERWAATEGAVRLRTAVVGHHTVGLAFLEGRGYARESALADYDAGGRRASVVFLAKPLPEALSRGK